MLVKQFFNYINKRERIRQKKESGKPWPWTKDAILQEYKFTNVSREYDKTTRWMRKNWTIPNEDKPLDLQFFNCCLFRYFGTMEFAEVIGWQDDWNPDEIVKIAEKRYAERKKIFTGAYVITNQGMSMPKYEIVCYYFLDPIWKYRKNLVEIARETKSWQRMTEELKTFKGFGGSGFMAKEVLQDAMHTPVLRDCVDRNTFCPIGPGAKRGLNRVFDRPLNASIKFDEGLKEMLWLYEQRKEYLKPFVPELELHDVTQFCLCEFDKYMRVKLGEGRPRSKYHR